MSARTRRSITLSHPADEGVTDSQHLRDERCDESQRTGSINSTGRRLHPISRASATAAGAIAWIRELTSIERQASATDALGQPLLHPFQLRDALIDAPCPTGGQLGPIRTVGGAIAGQSRKLYPDFVQRETDLLRKDDESDAPQYASGISAMARIVPFRSDQPLFLVEA